MQTERVGVADLDGVNKMQIGVPRESWPGEARAAIVPANTKKLIQTGFKVVVESGLGVASGFTDDDYLEVGASIESDRNSIISGADVVLRVRQPDLKDIALLKQGCVHISFLDPFNQRDLVAAMASQGVTSVSMEMIPRSTRAQKMDALSSQANLAGPVVGSEIRRN